MGAFLWLALHAIVAVYAPVRIIIDTDMSTDCDDVGALCMAHALADLGECEILAVVHNTGALHGTPSRSLSGFDHCLPMNR